MGNAEGKAQAYQKAAVFTYKGQLSDSYDVEGMDAAGKRSNELLDEICERLRQDGHSFLALGCGSCSICESCTYPSAPCRFPQKARPSVEAFGIDVVQLAADTGIHYFNGANTVTYFSVILY